jgi:hypothetical protein
MGKGKRHGKDKKKRIERKPQRVAISELVYRGNKYKTDALVDVLFQAEVGIFAAFVASDRKLTDHQVERGLASLIVEMRRGPLPPIDTQTAISATVGMEEELVTENVRRNWQVLFQKSPHPGRHNLIGVLRTILASVDTWKSVSPTSRGYLKYLEGFLRKLGVSIEVVSSDGESIDDEEDAQHELFAIGRCWHSNGDPTAARVFRERVGAMFNDGQEEQVVEICQALIAEFGRGAVTDELMRFAITARQALLGGPSPSAFGMSRPPG